MAIKLRFWVIIAGVDPGVRRGEVPVIPAPYHLFPPLALRKPLLPAPALKRATPRTTNPFLPTLGRDWHRVISICRRYWVTPAAGKLAKLCVAEVIYITFLHRDFPASSSCERQCVKRLESKKGSIPTPVFGVLPEVPMFSPWWRLLKRHTLAFSSTWPLGRGAGRRVAARRRRSGVV